LAHTCPVCGMICHCNGDIDNIDLGEFYPECTCCENEEDCHEEDDSFN